MTSAEKYRKKETTSETTYIISPLLDQSCQWEDPYEGWESTFGCSVPAKRGHRRVAYAPYIVGGFMG